uniref:Uncharacterized protein n=1 Tax=Tetraselmis sp. GSL018 TaxID=582737 RepID=A0A061RJJ0_9CHLO
MSNFTANNRATSVGNQLLTNYRKFLLAYERAYAPQDIRGPPQPGEGRRHGPHSKRLVRLPAAAVAAQAPSDKRETSLRLPGRRVDKFRDKADRDRAPPRAKPERADPLADLAAAAAAGPQRRGVGLGGQGTDGPAWDAPVKRVEMPRLATAALALKSRHDAADRREDLAVIEREAERQAALEWVALEGNVPDVTPAWSPADGSAPPPGELILVEDAYDDTRLWPAVAAKGADLPRAVADGGTVGNLEGPTTSGQRLGVLEAREDACRDEAPGAAVFPVLLVGASVLGWTTSSRCRLYSQEETERVAASWMPRQLRDLRCSTEARAARADGRRNILAHALKEAAALHHSQQKRAIAIGMVQSAAVRHIGNRLLGLEADIPGRAFLCPSSALWQSFRTAVQNATTPGQLIPQILLLAHQISPLVMRRGQPEAMWTMLRQMLMISEPYGRPTDENNGSHPIGTTPSCSALDDAVSALEEAIRWEEVAALWELTSGNATVRTDGSAVLVALAEERDTQEQHQPSEQMEGCNGSNRAEVSRRSRKRVAPLDLGLSTLSASGGTADDGKRPLSIILKVPGNRSSAVTDRGKRARI